LAWALSVGLRDFSEIFMRSIFKAAIALCLTALLASCGRNSSDNAIKGDIVEKIERPGGGVAAISTRVSDGGATVSTVYHVYLQKTQNPAQAVEVLDFDKGDPPKLSWVDSTGLLLTVPCGQIHHFSNFADVWSGNDSTHYDQIVVMLDNRGVCSVKPPP
jgi:hypothetical protein